MYRIEQWIFTMRSALLYTVHMQRLREKSGANILLSFAHGRHEAYTP